MECDNWLKDSKLAGNLHLMEPWFSKIHVATARPHPEITLPGNGGFLLHGIVVVNN